MNNLKILISVFIFVLISCTGPNVVNQLTCFTPYQENEDFIKLKDVFIFLEDGTVLIKNYSNLALNEKSVKNWELDYETETSFETIKNLTIFIQDYKYIDTSDLEVVESDSLVRFVIDESSLKFKSQHLSLEVLSGNETADDIINLSVETLDKYLLGSISKAKSYLEKEYFELMKIFDSAELLEDGTLKERFGFCEQVNNENVETGEIY